MVVENDQVEGVIQTANEACVLSEDQYVSGKIFVSAVEQMIELGS